MEVLLRPLARLDIGRLVTLLSDVYKMFGSARGSLTPMLVDTLDKSVSPTVNRRKEIMLTVGAKNMFFFSDGKVIVETVTKINKVGIIVNQMASLKEGDMVQVGREVLVWQREGVSTSEGRHQ